MTTGICRAGPGLVFADGRVLRDQLRPQPGAGGAVQFLGQYRERLGPDLDFDPGVGLEVVVPVWVGWRSSIGGDDREAALSLRGAAQRQDALDPGLGADVVDENQRGARPWPADASLVRPELLDDLGVIVISLARSRVRHDLLHGLRRTRHGGESRSGSHRPRRAPSAPGRGSGSSPSGTRPPAPRSHRSGRRRRPGA